MRVRGVVLLAGLWVLSLTLVAYAASQAPGKPEGIERVVSGENIGFRLEGRHGQGVTGTFMVKVGEKWLEVRSAPAVVPVK